MAIKIITDSTSDIQRSEAKKLGAEIVPLNVIFEGSSFKEGIDITNDSFYSKLKEAKELPTTSQPSPQDFLEYFLEAKRSGDTVIAILLSSKISGTVQSANIAKEIADYSSIYIIDSLSSIMGLRLLVEYALELRDEGKTPEEIVEIIEEAKNRVAIYAVVDTLEYFLKGGRLSKGNAMVGTLLNLKPIVGLKEGSLQMVGKARGLNNAINSLFKEIEKEGDFDLSRPVYFGYTETEDKCLLLMEKAKERFNLKNTPMYPVGCVIGTHAGPGASAIAFLRKK